MFETKRVNMPLTLKAESEGLVQAVFSTFNTLDRGGDVVLSTAFTHGQEVPMTAFGHNWSQPVGKGTILVETDRAVFDGGFFLSTQAGRETYETVKALGTQTEWSWGFKVEDASFEQRGDQLIRVIKRAEVFEVSPVLVGEGMGTYTLGIKSSQPYTEHAELVLNAVKDFMERSRTRRDFREKEGRTLSTANRDRLASLKDSLTSLIADLEDLLAATEPQKAVNALALYGEYQRTLARLNGVTIN